MSHLARFFDSVARPHIAVVGDVVLDEYVFGEVGRPTVAIVYDFKFACETDIKPSSRMAPLKEQRLKNKKRHSQKKAGRKDWR